MDKELIRIFLTIILIVCYFVNLMCLFVSTPLDILISNIIVWIIAILIIIGFGFAFWLGDE